MMTRDINHVDDSTEAVDAFRARSEQRPHLDVPKMTGNYRFEATAVRLFTNRTLLP
jgi:hypothetical protein